MRTNISLKKTLFFMLMFSHSLFANNYIVYSVSQNLPMGFENEKIQKNFYVNMGSKQGLRKGVKLNVYRKIIKIDSFDTKEKYQHKIKIGELEVFHIEENSSISLLKNTEKKIMPLVLNIPGPIIGDIIDVSVD